MAVKVEYNALLCIIRQGCLHTAGLCPQQTSPREHGERSWSWNLTQTTKRKKKKKTPSEMCFSSTRNTGAQPCQGQTHATSITLNHAQRCDPLTPDDETVTCHSKVKTKKSSFPHDLRGHCYWGKQKVWTMPTRECLGSLQTETTRRATLRTRRPDQHETRYGVTHLRQGGGRN